MVDKDYGHGEAALRAAQKASAALKTGVWEGVGGEQKIRELEDWQIGNLQEWIEANEAKAREVLGDCEVDLHLGTVNQDSWI